MAYYWYLRQDNEIFLDIDGKSEAKAAAKLRMCRRRLVAAIEQGKLPVKDVWFYPSETKLHFHLILRLLSSVALPQTWALYLGSDVFRACNNMMREWLPPHLDSGNIRRAADLLIVPQPYHGFFRQPDHMCHCKHKHTPEIMVNCPVGILLRGRYAISDFFGKPNKNLEPWRHFGKVKP